MAEPLIFEYHANGGRSFAIKPAAAADLPQEFLRQAPPGLPSVSELQAVRHYTRL